MGQAIRYQEDSLARRGLTVTDRFVPDTDAVHINTVLPDSVVTALLARLRGRKVVWYGHSTMEDFRRSFRGSDLLSPLFRCWLTFCYGLGDVVLEALACGIPTVLRDIPVYDGWLEHGKTVYKASSTDEFQRIVMDLLAGDLPDLTDAGRRTAEERSLKAVGERLKDIYRWERILPPLPTPMPRRRAKA